VANRSRTYLRPLRRGSWLTDRGTDSPTEIHRRSQHAVTALGDVGLSRTESRVCVMRPETVPAVPFAKTPDHGQRRC
jgi:hypothetical protein